MKLEKGEKRELKSGAWCIVGKTVLEADEDGEIDEDSVREWVLWMSPNSYMLPLPPEGNWVPVDQLARGTPKIEYIFKSNDEWLDIYHKISIFTLKTAAN